jgi:hypothetical protein
MSDGSERNLRDWFAGLALQGLLAGPNAPKKSGNEYAEQYAVRVAEEAYLFADAMIQASMEGRTGMAADESRDG